MVDKRNELRNILQKAPKPQLHFHLDGSLSFSFVDQSIQRFNNKHVGDDESKKKVFFEKAWQPSNDNELRYWLMNLKANQIAGGSVVNKNSNWKIFDICNQFLQTSEDLSALTCKLVTSMNEQHGVNYLEIRFAPVLHTLGKLTEKEAVQSVLDGFQKGVVMLKQRDIEFGGGIIVCFLRSYSPQKAFETVDLCCQFDDVIGFDIAGDEGSFPLGLFKDAILYAKSKMCSVTVHAGEWNETSNHEIIDNLRVAIDTDVDRIGHGLALRSCEQKIFDELNRKNIYVEACLTANCGNPDKCKSLNDHPLSLMISKDVKVAAMNVDNLLLSGNLDIGAPNPTDECVRALLDCHLTPQQLFEVIRHGYEAGFANNKKEIIEKSLELWQRVYLPKLEDILKNK